MKELIEVRHADINARDDNGRTTLMCAGHLTKHADIIAYLISKGGIE
jgi:hypothetical protein